MANTCTLAAYSLPSPRQANGFNSATPACAWRPGTVTAPTSPHDLLQFGHACLRVETRFQRRVVVYTLHTSIRPRLLARGDIANDPELHAIWLTSIRPRLLARGDLLASLPRVGEVRTSIRPRLLARGDGAASTAGRPCAALQFGHACLRVETF